jgi:2,3-bisphosphoglycerate-independent phosphoglycerate mutase
MVPSPKVATYDLQPEMSAKEVTNKLCVAIESQRYDLIVVNYANADMVGHTGLLKPAIKAVEALDECLGRLWKSAEKEGAVLALTADHGNVEAMVDAHSGKSHTAHTLNPVPFLLCGPDIHNLKPTGGLADIAPTFLDLMDIEKPAQMSGQTLLIR